ncbi:MAG TPA: GNAT family N-acetyltransferase [Polyangiaceae bacterium]|nr:GNAT family N-acetyltransferase [Polyangiaceae bacterium]
MGEPGEIRSDIDANATRLADKLASPVDLYLLAVVEGRIAGTAALDGTSLARFAHSATLGLAVSREYWGRGIGRALVEALLRWADASGLVRVSLEVVETNTRAIRLYESLGFEHEGRLRCCRKHGDVYLDNHQMARIRTSLAPA